MAVHIVSNASYLKTNSDLFTPTGLTGYHENTKCNESHEPEQVQYNVVDEVSTELCETGPNSENEMTVFDITNLQDQIGRKMLS